VSFSYRRDTRVLDCLNLEVESGVTLLVGDNGVGKTTLLKLAAGVEKPDRGNVLVNGFDLWRRERKARSDLAFVPQEPEVTPFASIVEVLRLVCRLRSQPLRLAEQYLGEVGLQSELERSMRELSRGQRRRVLLAAAWIGSPRTVVLDEPLDAMDSRIRRRVHEWLVSVRDTGGLVLVTSHEFEAFLDLADHVLMLRDGQVKEIGMCALRSSSKRRNRTSSRKGR
jgi:ABC-2 type transport system ATP-binding protein